MSNHPLLGTWGLYMGARRYWFARKVDHIVADVLAKHMIYSDHPPYGDCGSWDACMRLPKVRTSAHRNKEKAARLQAMVDKRIMG